MDNSFAVGLSAQQVLQQRMDVTANNLANMTTAGFKAERLMERELSQAPAQTSDQPTNVSFVDAWKLQRDMSTGPMERTGNSLDAAIDGEGFFSVQTPDGVAYTRDGRFQLDGGGKLVNHDGFAVMGQSGPITVDPNGGDVTIGRDGTVFQNSQALGQISVTAFDQPDQMVKMGSSLWQAPGQTGHTPTAVHVSGGFVEGSNVNPVAELTQMIEISRSYESVAQMLSNADQLRGTAVDKLSHTT